MRPEELSAECGLCVRSSKTPHQKRPDAVTPTESNPQGSSASTVAAVRDPPPLLNLQ
ncbi:hypothetical protein PGTUg99_029173 [Puccinia graminis f. sp. tritici]|uniref:Uncharacterized protein n=1 Tax=Puccinia graminis f. sp. tritici TaxID=56615 RepID=A0A5B0PNR2_PUCGR|nr:hypothetical protein PGTUg99_029173 [Puccinia graminis f. sp. tritici]